MAFGDIYENRDVVFGPAFIDAYRLEKKAVWPRVLIDESLLDKIPDIERPRYFHEFFRMNGDNLVYLDYLREIFHLFLVGENTRIQKKQDQDFGSSIAVFSDHKEAILAQIGNAQEEENINERTKILKKYKELFKYHNSTIFRLRRLIIDLMTNTTIVRELFNDQLQYAEANKLGLDYQPKYGAEEHPEQGDMLDILCIAMNRVITRKLENGSYDQFGSPLWEQYKLIDEICLVPIQSLEILNNEIQEDAINSICQETPQELRTVGSELTESTIHIGNLTLST